MDPISAGVTWNIICSIFAGATGIIAWFARNHYADLDKKNANHEAEIKLLNERLSNLVLQVTRNEAMNINVNQFKEDIKELKDEMKYLRNTVNEIKIEVSKSGKKLI
jgi:cell division protein FtsB